MPIYEYECPKCGVVDAMQKITEDPLKTCPTPKCRRKVRKLMSSTQFQLKGSGWYVTDYGKAGQKPAAGEGATAEPSEGVSKSESSSADTKKATKQKSGTKKTAKKQSAA
jgi:putative FmdB family regulatory protein